MPSPQSQALAAKADAALADVLRRADAARDAVLGGTAGGAQDGGQDGPYGGRRVADVLAHLHAWHVVFDGWVAQARAGAVPAFPAEGYSWDDLAELNGAFYQAHRDRPYDAVRGMLVTSHRLMLSLLDSFSEEELTDPAHFPWLRGQALGDVANECLAAHYAWALRTFDAGGIA